MSKPLPLPERLSNIINVELVVFDFDGVFTDNTVWITEDGKESVRCWRSDGLGLRMLKEADVKMYVLSTEENNIVLARCKKLGINCINGITDKRTAMIKLTRDLGVNMNNTVYVGNDINDRGALEIAGVGIVVQDAHPDVFNVADYQTSCLGGFGAVREVCDVIANSILKP